MLPNLNKWAFLYFSAGSSPEKNTTINQNETGGCIFITVGFDPSSKMDDSIIRVAKELVDSQVQTIELCGGFGPEWVTKISESINYKIPVGAVMYGPEHRKKLLEIMKP